MAVLVWKRKSQWFRNFTLGVLHAKHVKKCSYAFVWLIICLETFTLLHFYFEGYWTDFMHFVITMTVIHLKNVSIQNVLDQFCQYVYIQVAILFDLHVKSNCCFYKKWKVLLCCSLTVWNCQWNKVFLKYIVLFT